MELFDKIKNPIIIGKRLVLRDIEDFDKLEYFSIYTNEDENKYWGYDYKEDLKKVKPTPDYFILFQSLLKENKLEYSLAVTLDNKMIGEVVMHNFTENQVELGVRISKNYQSFGYGYEAMSLLIDYVKEFLQPKVIISKCYLQNIRSYNLLTKCGFNFDYKDDTYNYFKIVL